MVMSLSKMLLLSYFLNFIMENLNIHRSRQNSMVNFLDTLWSVLSLHTHTHF